MYKAQDIVFMKKALSLAGKGAGLTGVNPLVGAVLVKDGRVIGQGYHVKDRLDHAEIVAMKGLSFSQTSGATLYVTLEPCCHLVKATPPCTGKLIEAGIGRIVIGLKDPNKRVCGRGIEILRTAGIQVLDDFMAHESALLNEFYIFSIGTSLPFVAIKQAVSLDGKIAAGDGSSRWISNPDARKMVHKLRSIYDSVMTSGMTVVKDDPQLNVRLVKGRNPRKIVVDWGLDTDLNARVYHNGDVILITSMESDKLKEKLFLKMGVQVRRYNRNGGLRPVLVDLYAMGIGSILVEAGGRFAAHLLSERLVNKFIYFVAPLFLGSNGINSMGELDVGSMSEALVAKFSSVKMIGDNLMIEVIC